MNARRKPIDIKLTVEVKDKTLIAHLLFFNNTFKRFYLDKHSICFDGKFSRNVFSIVDDHNSTVEYIGEQLSRSITPDEFIWLEVGEYIKTSVKLNSGYNIIKRKRYQVKYTVVCLAYLSEQDVMRLESNMVQVAL